MCNFRLRRTCSIRAAVTLVCVLLVPLTTAAAQRKSLVIAVEDGAGPWSLKDGTGYANDVVVAAFKAVAVDVELRVMPYARCKRMVMYGDIAACFSMSASPDFKEIIAFSERPIFSCYAGYFYNLNKPPRVPRQQDLPARTLVGTVIGYEYPPAFERLVAKGIIVIERSPSEEINLKKLAFGRIDLALLNYNEMKSADYLLTKAGVNGKVKVTFRSGILDSYIGFSRRHPDGPWALREFNKGYRLIIANGTLRRLKRTWSEKLTRERVPRSQ
jgi:polar amino acid transport system substrate-binding protein